MPPQLIALAGALSYAVSTISARRGMSHSTPITVTCVSLMVHTVALWSAVLLTGGIPDVAPLAVVLFIVAGMLQPVIRLFTYSGVFHVGTSRSTTLRSTHPLFSTTIAIVALGEDAGFAVIMGTLLIVTGIILISWRPEAQPQSFRWRYIGYPLGAALLAGIVHPIRRFALGLSAYPLFFAALVGLVGLISTGVYLLFASQGQRPLWNRKSMGPFLMAGVFETFGILMVITALSHGRVVVVSPIVATGPMWVLVGTYLFLRDLEQITSRTIAGTLCVISGTVMISLVR